MRPTLSALFGAERNFQILVLANTTGPIGLVLLSPVLDSLTDAFGVSPVDVGLLMSAYTAAMILAIPVVGVLSERYGRKPILVGGILLSGTAGVAIAFTTEFRIAVALRLLQGFGGSAIVPTVITSIGDLYEEAKEATAQGIRFTSSGVAQAVVPLLGGVLVGFAWQYPFFLYLLAFPIAAVVYLNFDETGSTGGAAGGTDRTPERTDASQASIRELLAHRRVVTVIAGCAMPAAVWVGFLTYVSIVVVQFRGWTAAHAGALVSLASLAIAASFTQAGRIAGRFESRLSPLVAGHLALGSGFVVGCSSPGSRRCWSAPCWSAWEWGSRCLFTGVTSPTGAPPPPWTTRQRLGDGRSPPAHRNAGGDGAAIAVATPSLSFQRAVQTVGLGVALIAVGAGIATLFVARAAPRLGHEH
ncbi:MFS transporter [Halobium palmae]|uniref:MFS transporter n=1 Tax=Halobium palmae TaxID=1776492 RepID=A0ABD5RXV9_9EURY